MVSVVRENFFFDETPKHRGEDLALWFVSRAFKTEPEHSDMLRCLIQDTKAAHAGFIHSPIVGLTMMRAITFNRKDIILTLISEGASVNMMYRGVGMVHKAVKVNNIEMLTFILSLPGIKIDMPNVDHRTALMEAMCGKPKCVQILLEAGCDVNQTSYGSPIIHVTAQSSRGHPENIIKCLDILLDHGVDINSCDTHGRTCLSVAVETGNRLVVCWLIQHNCDLNKGSFKIIAGGTLALVSPFLAAVRKEDPLLVATLLACGCRFVHYRWILKCFHWIYHERFKVLFEEIFNKPRSLQSLCRNVIRTHLSVKIEKESEHLGLPKPLQRFVLCEGELKSLYESSGECLFTGRG